LNSSKLYHISFLAQETVCAELIQAEISQVMLAAAKRYENSSAGFAITTQERNNFEKLADIVNELLRKEMQEVVAQLQECFQELMVKKEQGSFLDQEWNNRMKLNEFADILAHKSLIDGRIALIQGEQSESLETEPSEPSNLNLNVNLMLQSENLFSTLSEDICPSTADDILMEADFKFMFKKFISQFESEKEDLSGLSNILISLEEVILALHNKLNPEVNLQIQNLELDNVRNISIKLYEFQQTLNLIWDKQENIDNLLQNNKHLENEKIAIIERLKTCENLCQEKSGEIEELITKLNLAKEEYLKIEKDYGFLYTQIKKLENHLEIVESNYKAEIDELHQHYQEKLSEKERQEEEQIRQKYQEEIEQLRVR
jgi:hypothetical protein